MRSFTIKLFATLPLLLALSAPQARAAEEVDPAQFETTVSQAIEFLSQSQAADGSYSADAGPGVTALCTTAILLHGRTADDPTVAKSLEYLEGFIQDDGGIYTEGSTHRNYETAIAMNCLVAANADGRYDETIANASNFLKGIQWGGEDADPEDVAYGGAGYGSHNRPDLSNTSFLVEALNNAGADANDEAIQRALIFVSRCQNLETEHNQTEYAAMVNDGGFYYTIAAGGSSQAGETDAGGLRSYGSMTYAGLKSMIYAGVDQSDPRVQAAYAWIQAHYTLEENPGMGETGLYYYYNTFSKSLAAMGVDTVTDADGNEHNWRADLVAELAERQNDDGSWINTAERWLEGDPNLVTGYCLLALANCKPGE